MKLLKILSDLLPIPGYAVVIICFFLPFFTIKCGNTELVSITGFELAKGVDMEKQMKESNFAKELKKKMSDDYGIDEEIIDENTSGENVSIDKKSESKPAILLIVPLMLSIAGFVFGFIRLKKRGIIHIGIAVLSLLCLAIFGFTLKNSPELNSINSMGSGLGNNGGAFGDSMLMSVGLGNAYYVACFFLVVILSFYGFEMYWKKNFTSETDSTSLREAKEEDIDTFFE